MFIDTQTELYPDDKCFDKGIIEYTYNYSRGYNLNNNNKSPSDFMIIMKYVEQISNSIGKKAEIISSRNPQNRDGSIGTISSVFIPYNIMVIANKIDSNLFKPKSKGQGPGYQYYRGTFLKLLNSITVELDIDKQHKKPIVKLSKIKLLKDYTGENKYVFKKPEEIKKTEIILKDKFGTDITVGSMILFASSTSRQQGIPKVGKITKIHSNNYFKASNLKLNDKDFVREYTLRDASSVILFNDDLIDQISIARLSF